MSGTGGNPRSYDWARTRYSDKSVTGVVAAADSVTISGAIAAKSAGHTVFVQRIMLSVTTSAAQSLTFQDSNGTPKVIGKSPINPGEGIEVVADFGPNGVPLTEGKNLNIVISGAGLACVYNVEAYEKLTAVVSSNAGASLQ